LKTTNIMKIVFFLAIAAIATASTMTQFAEFTSKHGKVYASSEEFQIRFKVFEQNLKVIDQRNAENIAAGGEAVHGITQFADMTQAEFESTYLMNNYQPQVTDAVATFTKEVSLNTTIDWTKVSPAVLTPIKDQGRCGSCWAFSATSAIESYAKLAGKELQILSPQQITSCDKVDGGCNGGNTETAYNYVVRAGGLELESSYPYKSGTTGTSGTCVFDASKIAQKITGFTAIPKGEANLLKALNEGPASVCLGASTWNTYTGGILRTCPGPVDHCVQAVAFNPTSNAWTLRNQWGTSWGEKGFIQIAKTSGNGLCALAGDATFPTF